MNSLIVASGYLLNYFFSLDLLLSDISVLAVLFSLISLISLVIFSRGQKKEPESQTMHSLVSVTLKFLLEMVLALIWFIVIKKTAMESVLIFFVLYLTLTLFWAWIVIKTLKSRLL